MADQTGFTLNDFGLIFRARNMLPEGLSRNREELPSMREHVRSGHLICLDLCVLCRCDLQICSILSRNLAIQLVKLTSQLRVGITALPEPTHLWLSDKKERDQKV
jgi:hypothetical protein